MIELYHYNNSVCSQKVRIVLFEKSLDWEGRLVDLFKSEQYAPAYLALNPKGVVPTIVHDGKPVYESTLICEYLDETFPDPPLKPADPYQRTKMRLWSKAVDEGLHAGVTMISFSAMFRERMKEMSAEEREIRYRNVGDPARRDRFESTFEHGVESPYVFHAIGAYEIAFKEIEARLSEPHEWLAGGRFSLAEANLAPYLGRLEYLTLLDVWLEERPATRDWWQRIKARPSVQAAIPASVTADEVSAMKRHGSAIKDRIRELRADYLSRFRPDSPDADR